MTVRILTVIGTRPQFIKAAAVSQILRTRSNLREIIVHTGQHFDDNMSRPNCVFTNVQNPRSFVFRNSEFKKTFVKRGVTIGANATIVCGSEIGRYAFVGAGAVITGDVPSHAIMAGIPARRVGWMSRAGERLGPTLVCPAMALIIVKGLTARSNTSNQNLRRIA